jgi:hypothetical protein
METVERLCVFVLYEIKLGFVCFYMRLIWVLYSFYIEINLTDELRFCFFQEPVT